MASWRGTLVFTFLVEMSQLIIWQWRILYTDKKAIYTLSCYKHTNLWDHWSYWCQWFPWVAVSLIQLANAIYSISFYLYTCTTVHNTSLFFTAILWYTYSSVSFRGLNSTSCLAHHHHHSFSLPCPITPNQNKVNTVLSSLTALLLVLIFI